MEEQRVNVIFDFTSPRSEFAALGHGYRVMTRVVISERRGILKVPVGALFRTGDDWTAFVNEGDRRHGKARLQKVALGERNTLEAEVKDGLSEGQLVIIHPSNQIAPGVSVEARRSN